jgi:hypothetical protein
MRKRSARPDFIPDILEELVENFSLVLICYSDKLGVAFGGKSLIEAGNKEELNEK